VRNTINADYSIIPGGENNTIGVSADHSFAGGQNTNVQTPNTFAWSDKDFSYQTPDEPE
jgi:hypothetical protein